jgi:glycogen(starch) synthase
MNLTLMPPKRILMTADTVGGVWTYALELSRALGRYGIEIALATMGAALSHHQRAEVESIPHIRVCESTYKLEWMNDPWDEVAAAGEWLLKLEDEFHPDVIHLNGFCHGALPWRVPKLVVGHSCVLSWWRAVKGCDAPADWDTYRKYVAEGLGLAELVVAPSHAMLAALNEHYGPFAATTVIPNGRHSPPIQPGKKYDFILAAGRLWDEAKNISAIAQIAPHVSWPIYLAGQENGPGQSGARHSEINYLGHLPQHELQVWFDRAAIYVAPARYEPFGLSVLEAALGGCALVLGDIPSLRENWSDAALFVPPDDPVALKAALRKLTTNSVLRAELSANARRVASRFTPEKMAEGYLAAYSELARKSPRNQTKETTMSPNQPGQSPASYSKGASCVS